MADVFSRERSAQHERDRRGKTGFKWDPPQETVVTNGPDREDRSRAGGIDVANFGPVADGAPIYGACRPGHLGGDLSRWVEILRGAGVSTVVCLLSDAEAARWGLPAAYDDTFETYHLPVRDRHLPDPDGLARTLDVLEATAADGGRAAVHCNAGLGRTGVVGAAWLVRDRGYPPGRALEALESTRPRRAPREAIRDDNVTEGELYELLERV